jgi:hypothetical protein
MKKIILSAIAAGVLFCFTQASAQDKRTSEFGVDKRTNSLEIGVDYLMPYGDFGKIYDDGVGAAIRYRVGITEGKSLLASVGYNTFKGQLVLPGNNPKTDLRANFLPIKVGMKFQLFKYVYVAGEIGPTFALGVQGTDNINSFVADDYKINGLLFNFAPSVGVLIPAGGKNYIDLGIRYEGMTSNLHSIFFTGIRAAYTFDIAR